MRRIALIVVILLPIIMSLFLWYLGAFSGVTVEEKTAGPYLLVLREQTGPYKQSGKTIREVMKHLREQGVEEATPFGIFYDNPDSVPEEKLRSEAGCIIREKDRGKLTQEGKAFKVVKIDSFKAAAVHFPFKNFLSIIVGVSKAYPALNVYMKSKGLQPAYSIEIYETGQIIYLMPLENVERTIENEVL